MTTVDWAAYERCPVCFRAYDCRSLRRGRGRYLTHIVAAFGVDGGITRYVRVRVDGIAAGWYHRTLKRPHRGRRKREVR